MHSFYLRRVLRVAMLALILAIGSDSVQGQVVIDTDTIIDADNSFPNSGIEVIDGENGPTVVQVVEGGGVGLTTVVRGSSVLTISGGELLNVSPGGDAIAARDNSTVNITGGRIGVSTDDGDWHAVHAYDSGTVNITGGEISGEGDGAIQVWERADGQHNGWSYVTMGVQSRCRQTSGPGPERP